MKIKPIKTALLLVASLLAAQVASEENSRTPEDILKEFSINSEKAIKIPAGRAIALFDKDSDEVAIVTDNPRWVVKGKLYDMFQNIEIKNGKELTEAAKKIPLYKLKVDAINVLSFTYNQNKKKQLDVFIDPFSDTANEDIKVIMFAAKELYRIRFILTPFKQESVKKLMQFACNVYKESSVKLIRRIESKQYGQTKKLCRQELVSKSYGLAGFIGLSKSPTLIATNSVVSFGMPKSIVAYLAKNME